MPQEAKKKPVSATRRKARVSTAKSRKGAKRPESRVNTTKKTAAKKKTVTKITPVIIDRKEEVKILPAKKSEPKKIVVSEAESVVVKKVETLTPTEKIENAVAEVSQKSANEMKSEAIEKAMLATTTVSPAERKAHKSSKRRMYDNRVHFGFKRVLLALACAGAAVFAIVYFVNRSTPNLSWRVAAIQNGIEATYPKYVPRDFDLSDITSENGKITLSFRNSTTGDAFAIVEEKSAWDSTALLNNFVKSEYSDDYTTVKEQGLTLYIDGSNACWVNGGKVFKLKTSSGSLTKKQIKTIATSL